MRDRTLDQQAWRKRFEAEGMPGLVDRSRRPKWSPSRVNAAAEVLICQLRREHPLWRARRIVYELGRRGMAEVPGRATVHRVMARNGLVKPQDQQHKRTYRRWQRDASMQLWQMDIVSGVPLADGRSAKLVTGIDDDSLGSSSSAPWSWCQPGGRSARRSRRRCAATGSRAKY